MRLLEVVSSMAWAIEENALRNILQIVMRENEGPEAVAAKLGRPLQNTRTVTVRDGVALVPVVGPIFRRANLLTEISGATSTEVLARDFRAAVDDSAIRAIVLEIDSPGGEANGVGELAAMIREARGQKPIVAYVGGMAASGAYWIASAADEIVVDQSAILGSIGVVSTYRDEKGRDEKAGIKTYEVVSSQSPNKRPNLESDDGRAQIQRVVDAIADVFVDAVAENRGVDRETVLRDFGAGGVTVGRSAIAARMADGDGSLEDVIADLASGGWSDRRKRMLKTHTQAEVDEAVTFATAKATEQAKTEARAEAEQSISAKVEAAVKLERERISGIDAKTLPGHEKLAAECKSDGTTVEAFAVKQIDAEKTTREQRLAAIKKDGKTTEAAAVATETGDKTVVDESALPIEERAKAEFEREPAIRKEFGTLPPYVAYRKAEAAGRVRNIRRAG